ncbi:hypothetical protein [Anaeroselena agilis]|uniref:Uncharacterized protein n=1 Tax=Anaeroselena agilis TaxID=3063788 RepID=A0ABU3NVL7_9FIRM|nr:hypothetical protein [Selenomonadales bacterium 4137-cl]
MKEIIAQVNEWPFLRQLPARQEEFSLSLDLSEDGMQYNIFSYRDAEELRSFSIVYDQATRDFLARVAVGLNEFYDVSFICPDIVSLERILTAKLVSSLVDLSGEKQYESIFRAKRILEWPYSDRLAGEIAGFRLFITPRQPLKTVNGSYVILDYSDFDTASNLSISYNVYRDEFFGQTRLRRTPQMIGTFDARDLGELAAKLDCELQPSLADLRWRVEQSEGEVLS